MCVSLCCLLNKENTYKSVFPARLKRGIGFLKMLYALHTLQYTWMLLHRDFQYHSVPVAYQLLVRLKLALCLYLICSPIICSEAVRSYNANFAVCRAAPDWHFLSALTSFLSWQAASLFIPLVSLLVGNAQSTGQSYLVLDRSQLQIVIGNGVALIKFR